MKNDIDIAQLLKGFSQFLHRYHVLLFTLLVLGGLALATFLLYETMIDAQTASPISTGTSFDKATIEKINQLKTTDDGVTLTLPSGRTNPFSE